jgi:myo-inositol-1(or 4)-monophosphatase
MEIMVRAAIRAARALVRDFGEVEQLQVSIKGPADYVSAADRRAEQIIFEELRRARPTWGFLMEESGEQRGEDPDRRWIVDPLDGTTNFLHGLPHWSISIALEERGEITAGLVYDPVKNELFVAEKGQGAFMNDRRIRVSSRRGMEAALIGCGLPVRNWEGRRLFARQMERVADQVVGLRRLGTASLDLAYVAMGRQDGFWEFGLKPWDMAAGILLVREAGGLVGRLEGDGAPTERGTLVAGNPWIYEKLRATLEAVGREAG